MPPKPEPKLFVLDTNVILHDSSCITQFKEHDIVVPMAVLEELDQFKKGNEEVNFHARDFLRRLDSLSSDKLFDGGIRIGRKQGKISIKLDRELHPDLRQSFTPSSPDHRILNTAYNLQKSLPKRTVILITKDVNLRMKSKAVGLMAQDYTTDRIEHIEQLYTGRRIEENVDDALIDQLYSAPFEIDPARLKLKKELSPNEFLILKSWRKSALGYNDPFDLTLKKVDKEPAYGVMPRNAEQTFALRALTDPRIQLVTLTGKSGTGKTLLALAAALEKKKFYKQLYVARPIVPLSNKDLGFLPGDIQSKLDPYMQPLHDNLSVIQHQFPETDQKHLRIRELLSEQKLVISPLAYIRGRSLSKIYFIVDEAQNLTPHEVKTVITRAGEGTKIVFTGDIYQIDHPYLDTQSNGLSYLIDRMQGQKVYAHINLEKGERSELANIASELL